MRRVLVLAASLALGCGRPSAPAQAPDAGVEPASGRPPEATASRPNEPPALPPPGEGQTEASASCPKHAPLPSERTACPTALADLASSLGQAAPASDARLATLEACDAFPVGSIRALRAQRWLECADEIVQPVVGAGVVAAQIDAPTRDLLVGLGLAGRLARLVGQPPEAPPRSTKPELEHYLSEHLFPWATRQASAIGDLSRRGASLRGYARGVVAIEAALADLRFVEMARGLPLPEEMQDPEIQAEYYGALDQALEPRKDRARDAALVALGEFSALGILQSAQLDRARQLIARVFAGNRIVALDALLVPPKAACQAKAPEEVLAAGVESPLAALLLGDLPLTPTLTTCLLERGLSTDVARRLEADQAPGSRSFLARAQFDLGRTYMKQSSFQRAADLYAAGAAEKALAPEDELLFALSSVLTAVPQNAADLFRVGPRLPAALGQTEALDVLTSGRHAWAGAAGFDAAYLRELTAPAGSAEHFNDVAARYDSAARKLQGKERGLATDRARAARSTAQAIAKQLK